MAEYVNDKAECTDSTHKVEIDFVTFITQADEVWRKNVFGTPEEIKAAIKEMIDSKSPNAEMYITYCCDKCKEANND